MYVMRLSNEQKYFTSLFFSKARKPAQFLVVQTVWELCVISGLQQAFCPFQRRENVVWYGQRWSGHQGSNLETAEAVDFCPVGVPDNLRVLTRSGKHSISGSDSE